MASAESLAPARPLLPPLPPTGGLLRLPASARAHVPLLLIAVLLAAWGSAVALWGLPALALPAVAFAPLMLGLMVAITRG